MKDAILKLMKEMDNIFTLNKYHSMASHYMNIEDIIKENDSDVLKNYLLETRVDILKGMHKDVRQKPYVTITYNNVTYNADVEEFEEFCEYIDVFFKTNPIKIKFITGHESQPVSGVKHNLGPKAEHSIRPADAYPKTYTITNLGKMDSGSVCFDVLQKMLSSLKDAGL